jgi:hypothetical protein
MLFDDPEMFNLGLNNAEQKQYNQNKILTNKKISSIQSEARRTAKLDYCYYCKKPVLSFCSSHSVPQFCLRRIAVTGKVYYANTLIDLPFMSDEQGVGEAGTFQLICRDCDSKIFQEYENPFAYQNIPTSQILAQIAMKNYLQMIGKRLFERALYNLMGTKLGAPYSFVSHNQEIISHDLAEYNIAFNRAKFGALGNHDDWYYLCYYQKLEYTVPVAFQGGIVMISDFEDNIINDIYNMSPDSHIKEIHIAIFPLEKASVIICFIDSRDKCYKNFYKQLKRMPLEEQLSAINYIVFSYSENVYISKKIDIGILEDKNFITTCQKSSIAVADHPFGNPLNSAIKEFSLSKRNEIPNLLSGKQSL